MKIRTNHGRGGGLHALLFCALLGLPACADTELSGIIFDEDLVLPELITGIARGVNSEYTDVWRDHALDTGASTDDYANDASNNIFDEQLVPGDFRARTENFLWEQAHEASWSGIRANERIRQIILANGGTEQDFLERPEVAANWLTMGMSEMVLGESFCVLIYAYGPDGGLFIEGTAVDGPVSPYDPGNPVPADSSFKRALVGLRLGVAHAQAAVDAGVSAPDGDTIFDPQHLLYANLGAMAQAHRNLEQWDSAVFYAAQVPTAFVHSEIHHEDVEDNGWSEEMNEDDEHTMLGTPAAELYEDDPRINFYKCSDWTGAPFASGTSGLDPGCPGRRDRTSEGSGFPVWQQLKYTVDGDDIEQVTGGEMRLIEAEAALIAGDLGEFTDQINDLRGFVGVDLIDEPAQAGAFEYPNELDDAWSLLDRESYIEMWLEGQRFWDMRRWNHPFWTENHVLLPRHAANIPPGGRQTCYPLPSRECQVNNALFAKDICMSLLEG